MENKSHAIAAGTFVLLMMGLLIAMALWLTRDTSEQRLFEISSKEAVTGLQPQAGVRYKGVTVGRVTAISLDGQTPGNVLVRIAVSDNAPMTTTTFASLGFQGVTGLAFVQLDDASTASPPLSTSKARPARIPMRPGLMSRLTEQGGNLLNQLEEASKRMNALLAPENQQTLTAAVTNLGQAAASIQQLTRHADQALTGTGPEGSANLPRLTAQVDTTFKSMQQTSERLRDSAELVKNSAEQFRRTSVRMSEPGGTLDRIARSTEALTTTATLLNTTLLPRLSRTGEEATRTARLLGRAVEDLGDQPQSLLFGKGAPAPGPGETGFVAPPEKALAPAGQP
jgi:phospholipid/cholesterol/gamma-HCH transport system substrate-binding protein